MSVVLASDTDSGCLLLQGRQLAVFLALLHLHAALQCIDVCEQHT